MSFDKEPLDRWTTIPETLEDFEFCAFHVNFHKLWWRKLFLNDQVGQRNNLHFEFLVQLALERRLTALEPAAAWIVGGEMKLGSAGARTYGAGEGLGSRQV